jgi:hypothetical protein
MKIFINERELGLRMLEEELKEIILTQRENLLKKDKGMAREKRI